MLLFHNESASYVGPSGAYKLVNVIGGSNASDKTNSLTGPTGWGELRASGNVASWPGLATPDLPSGHGWAFDAGDLTGKMFPQSNQWSDQIQLNRVGAGVTVDLLHRFFQWDSAAINYIQYAQVFFSNLVIPSGFNTFSQSSLLLPEMQFPNSRTFLYTDMWVNQKAAGSGTLAVIQTTGADVGYYNTYLIAPDPIVIYNHMDYVSLLGYSGVPTFKHQPKPFPRVEAHDDTTLVGMRGSPSCLYDAKFLPVTDQIQVQMGYSGSDWPILSLYRTNGNGIEDEILRVSDNGLYTVNKYGYLGWHYHDGDGFPFVVVRHTQPKTFDLSITSILP